MRSSEIYEITGKPCSYVNRYLYNLRKYGLIERIEDFWILTQKGEDFIEYYERFIKNKNRIRKFNERLMKDNRKINERKNIKKQETIRKETRAFPHLREGRQVDLSLWMKESNRDEIEKKVVEVLIDHYNRTGSKFIYSRDVFEFADKLQVNPQELSNAIMNLRQDGIIYIVRDKTFNTWKIGIKKDFLELLKNMK